MRSRIEELEKQAKALSTTNETLSVENRTLKAKDIFRGLGYKPEVAETFVKAVEGDPTPDTVDAFAKQLGLQPVTAESGAGGTGETAAAEGDGAGAPPADTALDSMARGGSSSGAGGQPPTGKETMPRQEWIALKQTDPGKARQVLAEGRVQLRTDNPFAVNTP
jgi:hypothetical protein